MCYWVYFDPELWKTILNLKELPKDFSSVDNVIAHKG